MIFSDDDLKQLKESLNTYEDEQLQCYRSKEFKALLARLEAAEEAIDEPHYAPCAEIPCDRCQKILRWRKAAGK